jgi:hypothetical protein
LNEYVDPVLLANQALLNVESKDQVEVWKVKRF